MYSCYEVNCKNQVSEEYSYCQNCQEKHYPSHQPMERIIKRSKELAKLAPAYIPNELVIDPKVCDLCNEQKSYLLPSADKKYRMCLHCIDTLKLAYKTKWREHARPAIVAAKGKRLVAKVAIAI